MVNQDSIEQLQFSAVVALTHAMSSGDSKSAKDYSRILLNLTDALMMYEYHKEDRTNDGEDWKP